MTQRNLKLMLYETLRHYRLYAKKKHDLINALAYLHMEKEGSTKRARARGKKGRNKRS